MAHCQKPGETPRAGKLGGPRGGEKATSGEETVGVDYSHHILCPPHRQWELPCPPTRRPPVRLLSHCCEWMVLLAILLDCQEVVGHVGNENVA